MSEPTVEETDTTPTGSPEEGDIARAPEPWEESEEVL